MEREMMDVSEKIKALQDHEKGYVIEKRLKQEGFDWEVDKNPHQWNFESYDYRRKFVVYGILEGNKITSISLDPYQGRSDDAKVVIFETYRELW